MSTLGLIKTTKILNILLIVQLIIMLVFFYGLKTTAQNSFNRFLFLIVIIIVATILMVLSIVYSIIMVTKEIPGAMAMLLSSILVFTFPFTQSMLGIIGFVLSGISIIKLRKYIKNKDYDLKLYKEI